MESIFLNEIIQFTLGKNPTRIREQADELYTSEDFEKDLHCIHSTKEGKGCIINLTKSKCSPISEQTVEKCITSNFLRCDFDTGKLYSWFFCYQFNEGKSFEQQIEMYHQGTTLSVKKLNIKTIVELKIVLPDLEKQRTIGNIYRQSIIQNDLMVRQAEDIRKFTMTLIHRMEQSGDMSR